MSPEEGSPTSSPAGVYLRVREGLAHDLDHWRRSHRSSTSRACTNAMVSEPCRVLPTRSMAAVTPGTSWWASGVSGLDGRHRQERSLRSVSVPNALLPSASELRIRTCNNRRAGRAARPRTERPSPCRTPSRPPRRPPAIPRRGRRAATRPTHQVRLLEQLLVAADAVAAMAGRRGIEETRAAALEQGSLAEGSAAHTNRALAAAVAAITTTAR